ncbi:MAG TPA: SDR family oxidoreductase [Candidatus Acidoferrales bacterium]|nr:SDR family oxidoreductase [Candidatus Acidoferrales bacterium]
MPSDSLRGREVILAGGAGGIGAAVAESLLAEGARIVISFRTNRERAARWQDAATVIQADLNSRMDRIRLLDAAAALYGVVVLAGDPARFTDPSQLEPAMHRSHENNYLGPILLAREAAARLKAASTPGAIVLVSTMQANALFPGSTVYAAQKAALQHAALILARECRGPSDIRVNVVSPGITAAGMAEASIAAGKYDRFLQDGVIARYGCAADVARAVRFFLEPDSYVTGQVLSVDGGITL